MENILNLICRNNNTALTMITFSSFIFAALFLFIALFKVELRNLGLKIFASFLIVTIASLANNWIVYLTSALVVATLITELNFLENITAIITNREWWKIDKASKQEINQQTRIELPRSKQTPQVVQQTILADQEILKSFFNIGLFDKKDIMTGLAITGPNKQKFIFDAIASKGNTDYIIEVTHTSSPLEALLKLQRLKLGMSLYTLALNSRRTTSTAITKGILITQANLKEIPEEKDVLYIQYNPRTNIFGNTDLLREQKAE